jgi:cytochrome c
MKPSPALLLLLAALGLAASATVTASDKIAIQAGCATCHAATKKVLGPSYRDIAAKYKGQADAVALLSERIRKGSKGVWGPLPMTPTPATKLSDADLKAVVTWVLKTPH